MYCGKNGSEGSYYWRLASPSAYYSYYVCKVNGDYANLNYEYYSNTFGACPLVSLKSGIKLIITSE